MNKYIEREALKLKVQRYLMPNVDTDGTVLVNDAERYFLKLLDDAPTADVAEVRHGHWISYLDGDHIMPERYYQCSECGRRGYTKMYPYCNCGAKMDEK